MFTCCWLIPSPTKRCVNTEDELRERKALFGAPYWIDAGICGGTVRSVFVHQDHRAHWLTWDFGCSRAEN